ncbi:ferredoxin-thioredoxin reductase catalytic domain-containing protein [Methanocella sp. MCL-LM]|uniref:ferredoxin-thioredoxin reductase catalytic domain-containing protein n=1 Tax=Methanocella sp. MCL-LM TaxID=3412035 RepID=UPI003C7252C2
MEQIKVVPYYGDQQQQSHHRLPGRRDPGGAGLTGTGEITDSEIRAFYDRLLRDAEPGGYHLNPDEAFTRALVKGLLVNKGRYGYASCPCRLAIGQKSNDLDIICPCDYRDPDLGQYSSCYCGLYVSGDIYRGIKKLAPVPERRMPEAIPAQGSLQSPSVSVLTALKYPVWRCKVCGYLCAREEPPGVCPICKADKERFERFI